MVVATCGHRLTDEEGLGQQIHVKTLTKENGEAVDYRTVCKVCLEYYKKNNLIIKENEIHSTSF